MEGLGGFCWYPLHGFSISEKLKVKHQPELFQEDVCFGIRLAVTEQFAILYERGNGSQALIPGFEKAPEWFRVIFV